MKEDVLRTLVAIKLLNDHYKDKQVLWKLVEKKARDFCKINLQVSETDLNKLLDEVVITFHKNILEYDKEE